MLDCGPNERGPVRIDNVYEAGYGGEARVFLQLRNVFPGPGGVVKTEQDIAVAFRIPNGMDAASIIESADLTFDLEQPRACRAFVLFLKHAILKKLDDYFFKSESTSDYRYPHIPRPLGCTSDGAYFYEWVYGTESIPTSYYNSDLNEYSPLYLDEENTAGGLFHTAGVSLFRDTKETEQDLRKNIILEESGLGALPQRISSLWKRIDFGNSIGIDYDKLLGFLATREDDIIRHLGIERYEMIFLAARCLQGAQDPLEFGNLNRLIALISDYRISTANHMGAEGISPLERKLAPEVVAFDLSDEYMHEAPTVIRDFRIKDESILSYEIRREFPGYDGTIFTYQNLAVARITRPQDVEPDIGLRLFLRHFLVKKLENAFISIGKYTYPHICRPLGSEDQSYLYEWSEGEACCPREFVTSALSANSPKLAEWDEFVSAFRATGIEMESGLRWIRSPWGPNKECVKQIIVRQPKMQLEPNNISRMWMRVNFHDRSVAIDLAQVKAYLVDNLDILMEHLTEGRYETMIRAVNYLAGDLSLKGVEEMRSGIQKYRYSALRHLNYRGFSK